MLKINFKLIAIYFNIFSLVFKWNHLRETPAERVSSFKYLGVYISEDLTWTTHIQTQVKKARQRLYHATAEEIQGLTNNPENVLFRDHRNCIDSVYFSVVWKRLQSRLQSPAESCALSCQNYQGLEPP